MRPQLALTSKEQRELLIEIFLTLIMEILLYLSVIFVCVEVMDYPFKTRTFTGTLRQQLDITPENLTLFFFLITFGFVVVGLTYIIWRINRRIQDYNIRKVLAAITYISQGNYDYRIPEMGFNDLNEVITGVNQLVTSTVNAMEEERRIEKTKDELIANVGHDLRTPLTSILGYLSLIENGRFENTEELVRYNHIAYQKAQQMQTLVSDLFYYSVSRQTSYKIEPQVVQLNTFLEQITAEFELSLSKKGMEPIIDIQPEGLEIAFDVEKMARVYANIISNAIKYGKGADKLVLKARCACPDEPCDCKKEVTSNSVDTRIILEVRNNGELLNEDELRQVFSRSYRADQSRRSDEAGAGLGLAIVKNIVELHGGHVYAMVEDNELVFRMELPQLLDKVTINE